MPGQYSKSTIFGTFQAKATAKGFNLAPPKGEGKGISNTTPTMNDLLEAIAEGVSDILTKGTNSASLVARDFKIGPPGLQQPVATKAIPGQNNVKADMTTDPTFFTWIETFHSLLQASYPEPGNGSPNVFATALKSLLSLKPTSINAKITSGSGSIKVTT
jgi:hypothetical protein